MDVGEEIAQEGDAAWVRGAWEETRPELRSQRGFGGLSTLRREVEVDVAGTRAECAVAGSVSGQQLESSAQLMLGGMLA